MLRSILQTCIVRIVSHRFRQVKKFYNICIEQNLYNHSPDNQKHQSSIVYVRQRARLFSGKCCPILGCRVLTSFCSVKVLIYCNHGLNGIRTTVVFNFVHDKYFTLKNFVTKLCVRLSKL